MRYCGYSSWTYNDKGLLKTIQFPSSVFLYIFKLLSAEGASFLRWRLWVTRGHTGSLLRYWVTHICCWKCPTLDDFTDCSTPGSPALRCLESSPKFVSSESVMLSNHLILCHPLLPLPSTFPSIKVFISGSQSIGASASAHIRSNPLKIIEQIFELPA